MAENSRIDDLRRRVQKDPASIAFAQLAEECRRAGELQEAVDICRSGLEVHPGYLSARVTLGRALIELGEVDEAQGELARVLESAPENLAAIRGLAEIHHRRGELGEALAQYRAALLLARNDPDLEETIADLSHQIEPAKPAPSGGLTLEHMQHELLKHVPSQRKPAPGDTAATATQATPPLSTPPEPSRSPDPPAGPEGAERIDAQSTHAESGIVAPNSERSVVNVEPPPAPAATAFDPPASPVDGTLDQGPDERATRTVAALEDWLAAIHVARARGRA
jgi:tetratricopeptide (TPR) repeat protein